MVSDVIPIASARWHVSAGFESHNSAGEIMTHFQVVPSVSHPHNASPDFADYEAVERDGPMPVDPNEYTMFGSPTRVYFPTRADAEASAARRNQASDAAWKSFV